MLKGPFQVIPTICKEFINFLPFSADLGTLRRTVYTLPCVFPHLEKTFVWTLRSTLMPQWMSLWGLCGPE